MSNSKSFDYLCYLAEVTYSNYKLFQRACLKQYAIEAYDLIKDCVDFSFMDFFKAIQMASV